MKTLGLLFAATLALGAAGCTTTPTPPRDTGSMAFPAPLPQGTVGTTAPMGARTPTDTGNMAYPAPMPQGAVTTTSTGRSRTPTDTGNMAYPAPLPQGTIGTTPAK